MGNQTNAVPKRRVGPDIWMRVISWIGFFSWFVLFSILYILTKARPQIEGYIDKLLSVHLRKSWDLDLARYAFYLMIFLLLSSIFGFFVNKRRHKRKEDRYNISIIIMFFLSLFGIFYYLISF